jgi:hypothetical protein
MLYRPKFCCECGEKILRKDWKLWTSRRFCEVCEIDKKGYELLPKVIWALVFIFGLFGVGNLILKENTDRELKIEKVSITKKTLAEENFKQNFAVKNLEQSSEAKNTRQIKDLTNASIVKFENLAQHKNTRTKLEEPVYYCGAETKKGSFCKRRVKGGGRCWQHKGQPAILPPEKLLVIP